MELNKLHSTVITVMKDRGNFIPEREPLLFLVGSWYHKWLSSDAQELALKIPCYHKEIMPLLIEYQYWLDLLIRIMAIRPVIDQSGASLFDVRAYRIADRYQRQRTDFLIPHHSTDHRSHRFAQNIQISTDRFLPLFRSEQIDGRKEIVADAFALLTVIGRDNLIPYAVMLDMERDLTLFIKQTVEHFAEKAFAKMLCTEDFRHDHDHRDTVLDALWETDLQRCVVFTYPYHVDVSAAVINEFRGRSRICRIALSNRFTHMEVEPQDFLLTRAEIGLGKEDDILHVTDRFSIKNTDCGPELIACLRALRYEWNVAKFSVFTSPFPVKWLLCVHHGHTIDHWKTQFKRDYPEISGQLLSNCWHIIELTHELNWIDRFLPSDSHGTVVLPRSMVHKEIIFSLQEYLTARFKHVVLSDEIDQALTQGGRIYLLDAFNIILLNNITFSDDPENLQIVVPDFLFYTYQPFIRYLSLKHHFDALTGGLREVLDERYQVRSDQWKILSENVLRSSRAALRAFNNVLVVNDEDEQLDDQPGTIIDLSSAELVERVAVKERKSIERKSPEHLEIFTSEGKRTLPVTAPVLISQNGTLIRTIAAVLDPGTLFVPIKEIIKNMDLKNMVDRLVTLSDEARNWHQHLKELEEQDANIFDVLKRQGLSVSKQTFEKDYLKNHSSLAELHMPRAKQDWMLICQRLRIGDSRTAWNAVKCKEDINLLKAIYSQILTLMIDTESFGVNVSDLVLEQITTLLAKLPDPGVNAKENKKDAIALINEICDKVSLQKIEQINPITL